MTNLQENLQAISLSCRITYRIVWEPAPGYVVITNKWCCLSKSAFKTENTNFIKILKIEIKLNPSLATYCWMLWLCPHLKISLLLLLKVNLHYMLVEVLLHHFLENCQRLMSCKVENGKMLWTVIVKAEITLQILFLKLEFLT